jgi:hypothetical protein
MKNCSSNEPFLFSAAFERDLLPDATAFREDRALVVDDLRAVLVLVFAIIFSIKN